MTALSSLPTSSQTSTQWEAVGAWHGGTTVAVALSDDAQGLLASPAGVYAWTQPGGVVEPLVGGLNDLNVVAVAFAGGNAETSPVAFASTATGRLFQRAVTEDAKDAPWQEVVAWAGLGVAVVLTPSPAFADDRTLFVGTPTGIFRTQDGGQHWESCNFGLLDEEVLCMTCAPNYAESEVLWAGTAGGGLYRSRNSARAWRESGLGLPDAAAQSLVMSPDFATDRTLFVGMEGQGVYVSQDGGENWASFALPSQSINALAYARLGTLWVGTDDGLWSVDVASGSAQKVITDETVMSIAATTRGQLAVGLYGSGLWLSDDCLGDPAGIIWQTTEVALHAPPVVAQVGDAIFALDADGLIAQSPDGGAQWVSMADTSSELVFALDGARVTTAEGVQTSMIFAATANGLSSWNDAAGAWQTMGDATLSGSAMLGVDLSPNFGEDQTLLVMGHDSALRLSLDGGATWQEIRGPWTGESLLHAHFGPDGVNELVAVTVQPTESGHFALTVWNSTDLGQQWDVLAGLTSGVPAVVMAWPHDDVEHAIFLATQHRVIKLYHSGEPPTLEVHQQFFDDTLRVTALALAPDYVHSQIIWAATNGGLFRSVDRGISWVLVLDLPQELPVVWLDVTFTHVHAMTLGGRAWRAAL